MVQALPLNDKERVEVKSIAKQLVDKMKGMLVIDWCKKQRTKVRVRSLIEEVLDELPESFDDDLRQKNCSEIYMHVYEKYRLQGESVY